MRWSSLWLNNISQRRFLAILCMLMVCLCVWVAGNAADPQPSRLAFQTRRDAESVRRATSSGQPQILLVHYMPWYQAKPFSDHWGWHWTMNHFDPEKTTPNDRPQIASHYTPRIGPYDSADPHVLEYHLLLMKLAGIDGVIVDWYGLTDLHDYAILNHSTTRMLQQCERLNMKFVICYEDSTIPALVKANGLAPAQRVPHAIGELQWLNKYWFQSGAYLSLHDRPVLLSFGHAGLTDDEWSRCLNGLGFPVAYFSQDYRRPGAVGGFAWPAPREGLSHLAGYLKESRNWPAAIPVAFPRFHDIYRQAGVSEGYPIIADRDGKTFETTLQQAIKSRAPIIQIATWNDWGEGTQIEPSIEFGFRDLEHIQSVRKRYLAPLRKLNGDALQLPEQLFRARKQLTTPEMQAELDRVVTDLLEWQIAAAKHKLFSFAGNN